MSGEVSVNRKLKIPRSALRSNRSVAKGNLHTYGVSKHYTVEAFLDGVSACAYTARYEPDSPMPCMPYIPDAYPRNAFPVFPVYDRLWPVQKATAIYRRASGATFDTGADPDG